MNILRWKGAVWLASLAVGGYLAWYVGDFLHRKPRLVQAVSEEELKAVLDSIQKPEQPEVDVVPYPEIQRIFHQMDWTGKPPPAPQVAQPNEARAAPKTPVKDLLKVLAIQVDTVEPERSLAWVKFTDPKLTAHNDKAKEDRILRVGKRLFPPFQDVRVKSFDAEIDAGGQVVRCEVVFAFDDPERAEEAVVATAYASSRGVIKIVAVGPGGAILPQVDRRIQRGDGAPPPFNPRKTLPIRKNEFQIGTETLSELDRDYARILSRDVSYSTYRNPKTGAVEGIKVNRVAPDSLPAQHGLTEGEVLKSINGHKVTSVNDAIAFVKANAETTDTWLAVFEKQGREFTRTYHSPRE